VVPTAGVVKEGVHLGLEEAQQLLVDRILVGILAEVAASVGEPGRVGD
jgi:hypothetical protein